MGEKQHMDYITATGEASASFVEKKSEFIGYAAPVSNQEEALSFISGIREKNRKASHNAYAYVLRAGNGSGYSDDGEPQGTAGIPALNAIKKRELTDVCVVVTRYFGGILLGTGGLARAYSHAAAIALDAAGVSLMCECYPLRVAVDYGLYGRITPSLPEFEVIIKNSDFGAEVVLELLVKARFAERFEQKLADLTGGKAGIVKGDKKYEKFI